MIKNLKYVLIFYFLNGFPMEVAVILEVKVSNFRVFYHSSLINPKVE